MKLRTGKVLNNYVELKVRELEGTYHQKLAESSQRMRKIVKDAVKLVKTKESGKR